MKTTLKRETLPPESVRNVHPLTRKEQIFVLAFLETGSSWRAALAAGYIDAPHSTGKALLELPHIQKAIEKEA